MLSVNPIHTVSFGNAQSASQRKDYSGDAVFAAGTVGATAKPVNDAYKLAKLKKMTRSAAEAAKIANEQSKTMKTVWGRSKAAFRMFSSKAVKWVNKLKIVEWLAPIIKNPIAKAVGGVVGGVVGIVVLLDGLGQMVKAADNVKDRLNIASA